MPTKPLVMNDIPRIPGKASFSRIADGCALATAAIGLLVMVGWLSGIEPLKRVLPGLVAMKFNTALAFVMGGAALWWRQRPALRLGLGALVATFGALALGEYLSGGDWGIDQLFFREVPAAPAAAFSPGRMAPSTSLCFLLCGVALMCSRGSKWSPRGGSTPAVEAAPGRGYAVDVLAFGAAAIAGFVLIGYATGTESLHHLPGFISMALNTAAAFVLLAAGILCTVPEGVVTQAARSRDTGCTLWLGFGLLTILLSTLGVAAAVRLQSIGEEVDAHATVAAVLRSLQNTEVLIGALLVVGVLIVLVTSKLIGRAVLGHEQALRASEAAASRSQKTFAELIERSPFGTYVVDAQFRIAMMNAASQEGAFRNVRPVIGRDFSKAMRILWPEPVAAEIIGHFRHTLDTGEPYFSRDFVKPRADAEIVEAYEWELHRMTLPDGQHGVICYYYDSTKLRQAEAAVRESEGRLRALAEALPQIVWTADAEGGVEWYNQRWYEYTGQPQGIGEGWSWDQVAHPDDMAHTLKRWQQAREQGALFENELRVRRHDAQFRWFLVRAWPLRDAEGNVVRWFGTNTDVEDMKQAENALRESEGRLRLALEAGDFGTWELDLVTGQAIRSLRHDQIFGYQELQPEWSLETALAHVLPEDRQKVQEAHTPGPGKALMSVEARLRRSDGSISWVISTGRFHYDAQGRPVRIIGVCADITERKQAEQRLKKEKEFSTGIIQRTPAIICGIAPDGTTTFINPAGEIITGYRSEELIGKNWWRVFYPGDEYRQVERLFRDFEQGEVRDYEMTLTTRAGEKRVISWNSLLTRDRDGKIIHNIGFGNDITERIQAEAALRTVNESLEQRVAERTAEVQRQADQLRALAAELTQVEQRERKRLAKVLHDHIQQLLVAARMQVGWMQRDSRPERLQATLQGVDSILKEALDASRSLTVELSPPVLHEAGLLGGLTWLAARTLERNQFEVVLRAENKAEPPTEDARFMLFECAQELLLNAVKHSGVSRAHVTLLRTNDGFIKLIIGDEGKGFDPDLLKKRRPDEANFGLFSIQQRLIHIGGHMEIATAPGKGTRVTLTLPVGIAPPLAEEPGATAPDQAKPDKIVVHQKTAMHRVLIVDDHKIMRDGLVSLMQLESDIDVVGQAADGPVAIELATRLQPDVIIMDINLGDGMNGVEATKQILAKNPKIKVIGLSMHTDNDVATALRDAGAVAYLTKGGPAEDLIAAIRTVCAG